MSPRDSLSTPHINRLLRPLRNKCTALASEFSSSPDPVQPQATYSNNRTGWSSRYSPPGLTLIQPPGNIGIRIHLDDDYIRTAELARRIYAIRDCFRNVVQVSFGVGVGVNGFYKHALRIPSLAAMCAIVIGTTIQAEFDEIVAAKTADYDDHLDSDEVIELAYEMYEAIPAHYRRWTTVSHALSMILSTCPHHPTLLTILLDVCLSWDLVHESRTLLRALLVVSISPLTSPSICHPTHSSYYLDLCTTWVGESNEAVGGHSVHTAAMFVQHLVDVLMDAKKPHVWTCKAVQKLAREVRKTDFTSFVHIAVGLADTMRNFEQGGRTKKRKDNECEMASTIGARDQLNKWVGIMLVRLEVNTNFSESEFPPPSAAWSDELDITVKFLRCAQLSDLHLIRAKPMTTEPGLPDNIICLAVCCLACFTTQSSITVDMRDLVKLLRQTTPTTSTFYGLVALILDVKGCSNPPLDWKANALRKLQKLAELLRLHSLLKFEASLWACVLRCLEQDSFSEVRIRAVVKDLKMRIIDAVDEAESRCFGSALVGPSASEPSLRQKRSDPDGGILGGEWEWEEMVSCWIRRSPVVKRPKLDVQQPTLYTQRLLRNTFLQRPKHPSISASTTPSTSSSGIFSRSSGRVTSSDSFTNESDADQDNGSSEENHAISNMRPRPEAPRLVSNFSSILADAQSSRIVLHSHRSSGRRHRPLDFNTSRGLCTTTDLNEIAGEEALVPFLDDSFSALPSDDSLDLFAYSQSSPIAHR